MWNRVHEMQKVLFAADELTGLILGGRRCNERTVSHFAGGKQIVFGNSLQTP